MNYNKFTPVILDEVYCMYFDDGASIENMCKLYKVKPCQLQILLQRAVVQHEYQNKVKLINAFK